MSTDKCAGLERNTQHETTNRLQARPAGLRQRGRPFGLGHARKVFMERLAWRMERF